MNLVKNNLQKSTAVLYTIKDKERVKFKVPCIIESINKIIGRKVTKDVQDPYERYKIWLREMKENLNKWRYTLSTNVNSWAPGWCSC